MIGLQHEVLREALKIVHPFTDTYVPNKKKSTTLRRFQEWMAIPKGMRADATGMGTQAEFAKKYNISQQSLSRWKKQDGFWDAVDNHRKDRLDENLTEVYEALLDEAKAGKVEAIRFAFKLSGRFTNETTVTHQRSDEREKQAMSDEELAEQFAKHISEKTGADADDVKAGVLDAMNPGLSDEDDPTEPDGDTEDEVPEEELSEAEELLMDDEFEPDYKSNTHTRETRPSSFQTPS